MERLNQIGNLSVSQLPGDLYLGVKQHLNQEPCWRSFTNMLDGIYTLSDIEKDARDPDRVERLLLKLRSLEMTIHQFIEYVRLAQIEPILRVFGIRVPVNITHQPFPLWWNITVGESLSIELRATGSPPLLYQWFKDEQRIPSANGDVLQIPSACAGHAGLYTCEVRNNHPEDPAVYSNPVEVSVSPAKPLVIKEYPRSCTISVNGTALLTCSVWGDVNVDYQWMRNGKEVTDFEHDDSETSVSGSNTNELKIKRMHNDDWSGCYCCRISRGDEVIFTKDAIVRVQRHMPSEIYTASDKVALLMGAEDYRCELKLTAPKYDVQAMATIFRNLNFKVVSFLNLTKKEMLAAIHEFKYLVGVGVYCVFYFCGHGFEASSQCYLLPPDAPLGYNDSHCISADAILFNVLLQQKPKICCMILDICRLKREGKPELLKPPKAEYVVCYGTSQGFFSYERNNSGILVSYLKNILQSDIGIEEVFKRLRKEIKDDPIFQEAPADEVIVKQAPEIRTILSESDRSFRDKIDSRGHTQAFMDRQMKWENAHWQPEPRDVTVNFDDFNVIIRLDFQAEFSNVLTVFLSVVDPGDSKICKVKINGIPADIAARAKAYSIQEGTETSLCKNYLPLQDLQRLKADMLIEICVTCFLHDGEQVEKSVVENLGLPLVSRLHLWKQYPDLTRCQEAEEVDIADVCPQAQVYYV